MRDALGEVDVEPLLVDPRVVGLLVGEHACRLETLWRERLDDRRRLVPAVGRLPERIDGALEERVGDHVAHPRDRRVAPLQHRPAIAFGNERVRLEDDHALLLQLLDGVLNLGRGEQPLVPVGGIHDVLRPVPVDVQRHVVGRPQGEVVEPVDDADRRQLAAHRLIEDGDTAIVELHRERRPVVAVQRRLCGLSDAADEPGAVGCRRSPAHLAEEHQLHAAIHDRHRRDDGEPVEIGQALELLAQGVHVAVRHAKMHVEVREAADTRRRAVPDEEHLRHVDRAVLPRDEARRQRHVVELQRIGMVAHDRDAVDHVEGWRFVQHGPTLRPSRAAIPG